MKKKVLIIILIILAIVIAGFCAYKFYIKPKIVDFAFNKIVTSALSGEEKTPDPTPQPSPSDDAAKPDEGEPEQPEESLAPEEKVAKMPASEVARIVTNTPSLISELEKIASPADKQRVLNIVLRNFSKEEISKYAAKVSAGITAAEKNELIRMARSRISSAQWSECMQILYKYIDQLRPIIAKTIK